MSIVWVHIGLPQLVLEGWCAFDSMFGQNKLETYRNTHEVGCWLVWRGFAAA